MKGYFGPSVTCIYLDQFAASNILDQPSNDLWNKISELIYEKERNGKIICPVPPEHFLESSNKSKDRAILMDERFYRLGQGICFRPEAFVTANLIIALLRNKPMNQGMYCGELLYPNILSKPEAFNRFSQDHQLLNRQITEVTTSQNRVRSIIRLKKFPAEAMNPLVQAMKMMEIEPFLKRLQDLINDGHIITQGVEFATGPVIHWVDLVIEILLKHHQLNLEEAIRLKDIIAKTGFDLIPTLDIRVTLTVNLASEHKTENVNDQIDIMRLSTGLPLSDILFTDKQRKFELIQTGLDKKYGTTVFSGTNADLKTFRNQLQLI